MRSAGATQALQRPRARAMARGERRAAVRRSASGMSPATFSVASTRKSRGRPQAAETEALMETLIGILREQAPMTCRGAFYAASVVGAVPKTEAGYVKVQKALVKMRLFNVIPW